MSIEYISPDNLSYFKGKCDKKYGTLAQVDAITNETYTYKGSCTTAKLPTTGMASGDVWELTDSGTYGDAQTYVEYNGSAWIALPARAVMAKLQSQINVINNNLSPLLTLYNYSPMLTINPDIQGVTIGAYNYGVKRGGVIQMITRLIFTSQISPSLKVATITDATNFPGTIVNTISSKRFVIYGNGEVQSGDIIPAGTYDLCATFVTKSI